MQCIEPWVRLGSVLAELSRELVRFLGTSLRSRTAVAAENLFLRKQLALYRERQVKPRRATDALRLTLVLLARYFAWREALTIVQPATLLRWHRNAFRFFWRWQSRPGRSRLPAELQHVIATMAQDNPSWGEERIAAELLVKLGLRVSPRTVRRYMGRVPGGGGHVSRAAGQRWATFVRNHAQAIVACDFCVVVTATFRVLYVFVALELGSRRLLHVKATAHPTAAWTLQQFREILAEPHGYRFVVHDRDSVFSSWLDAALTAMGVRVLRTPVQSPMANAYCERLVGTLRRECLDILIPFGEEHLRRILRAWRVHYNCGRPHACLGPGLPEPPPGLPAAPIGGHDLPRNVRVVTRPILGGLHHEYGLEKLAA
jgi:putative transposase